MTSGVDDQFDWTTGQNSAASAGSEAPGKFLIPDMEVVNDIDEVERDAAAYDFKDPEPGDHIFVVKGLYKPPELITKQGYDQNDEWISYSPYKIGVRLGLKGQENVGLLEFFELPPANPQERIAFAKIKTKKDSGPQGIGWSMRRIEQFLRRLGFDFPAGGRWPADARDPDNWTGREVWATVEIEKPRKDELDPVTGGPKTDPVTGKPYPPRPSRARIKNFSYREVGLSATKSAQAPPASAAADPAPPRVAPGATPQTTQPAGSPDRPSGNLADQFIQSGLKNLV